MSFLKSNGFKILITVLSIVLVIISYVISKLITIPLNNMTKEMDKISKDLNLFFDRRFDLVSSVFYIGKDKYTYKNDILSYIMR